MNTALNILPTIWNSILTLGIVKTAVIVVVIAVLTNYQKVLGFVAAILFVAYLAGFI